MSLAIATCTFYQSLNESRFQLALRTLQGAVEREIPVALVDGGSSPEVLRAFNDFNHRLRRIHVFAQEEKTLGSAWRQAIREAYRLSVGAGVLRTEPEKYTFLDVVDEVTSPILEGAADIVIGDRRANFDSFPKIQQYSELFADHYVSDLLGRDIDLFAGPSAIGPRAIRLFLDYVPENHAKDSWDGMHIPVLRAMAQRLRVLNVPSSYVHPPEMKRMEEGDLEMNAKRLRQLNEVLPIVEAEVRRLGLHRF